MSITLGKILETLRDIELPERDPLNLFLASGVKFFEVEPDIRPVLKIRDDCPCTPKVRAEINAWLLETFGTRDHSAFAKGTAMMYGAGTLYIRKDDMAVLRMNVHS